MNFYLIAAGYFVGLALLFWAICASDPEMK